MVNWEEQAPLMLSSFRRVLSANTCSPAHEHIRQILAARRARTREGFLRCVMRAIEAGDLAADTDARVLARYFYSFEIGLSMEAPDGATGEELDASVSFAMKCWEANTPRRSG